MIQDLLTIEEIVKEKYFKIPDYQRGYSWEKDQLEDLVKDIEHISNNNHKHYTGTIVITEGQENGRFDVVDGQQRLTTLIILLNAIYNADTKNFSSINDLFLIRDNKYVLETNGETNRFFKEAILGKNSQLTADIKSLSNLREAKSYFEKWISGNESNLNSIYDTIVNKLGFICFSPKNTEEIGIMFEVINNRGKALSELEKIKNYFIYYSTIHNKPLLRDQINDNWEELLGYLNIAGVTSNDNENRFLRNTYIVFYDSNKGKSWNVYDELKKKYPPKESSNVNENIEKIANYIVFLINAARDYAYFYNDDLFKRKFQGKHKTQVGNVLRKLRCHPINASILPLYLVLMSQINKQPDKTLELLQILEKLNFRVYVLPNTKISRSDSKQGDLFWWANAFYSSEGWTSDDEEVEELTAYGNKKIEGDLFHWLKLELVEFTKYHSPEETIIQSLTIDDGESIDYYNWPGLRYFLACYEEHLWNGKSESWNIERILLGRNDIEAEKGNDHLSKEHIWASKNRVNDFPEDCREKRRLGNFVLIGLKSNIQLQEMDITEKVKYLVENDLCSMRQVSKLKGLLEEGKDFAKSRRTLKNKYFFYDIATSIIDQRENELIKFALDQWKLPGERFKKFDRIDSYEAWDQRLKTNYFLKD
jgi:uncharacterized protein with ParB-like and HNH nuclease domain